MTQEVRDAILYHTTGHILMGRTESLLAPKRGHHEM